MASTLATLATGGTVVVPDRFSPLSFWRVARDHGVTWYSAVPTLHQLLLARAADPGSRKPAGTERLRFIRSCSAALPPRLMHALESAFGAPVVEAYGMTEAAHQMTSNPLPPGDRKPGSVGRGMDVRVSIMNTEGRHLQPGERGEVVIQGPNVIRGYETNPEANATSFVDGWFRTGDCGYLDHDGYLWLVARIKELINRGGDFEVKPAVTGDLAAIGQADAVFLGVKAHGLTTLAPQLTPLLGPDTAVVSTQNGIPWWYFQGGGGELEGLRLECVDPGGVIAAAIEPRRVVGSLAYFATDIIEPGVIRHTEGNKISFGEPDGTKSDRCRKIAAPLVAAGFRYPITARFRHELWVKLLGSVAFNPISALTSGTLEELARHPDVSKVVRELMEETEAVAAMLNIELPISIDQRMAGAEKVGAHKTSMLQDLEAGRPMELDAIVGAVVELGARLGVAMPATRAVYACAKMLDEKRRSASTARMYETMLPCLSIAER